VVAGEGQLHHACPEGDDCLFEDGFQPSRYTLITLGYLDSKDYPERKYILDESKKKLVGWLHIYHADVDERYTSTILLERLLWMLTILTSMSNSKRQAKTFCIGRKRKNSQYI
jgi:hypothetical protein